MKTRITLLTLALAAVLAGCSSSITEPSPTVQHSEDASRDGMGMGNGN